MSELSELLADLRPYAARRVGSLRINTDDLRVLLAAIDAARAEGVAPVSVGQEASAWAWLAANIGMELSWGDSDDAEEGEPCVWRVHRRSGGRNDREWDLIATGATPLEAVTQALALTGQQDQVGGPTPAVLGEPSDGEEFLEFKEALSDLRSLRHEYECLSGGGPGWSTRNAAAWAKADELFANEDEAAYDRQQEDAHG